MTFAELAERTLAAVAAVRAPSTVTTLRDRLRRPLDAFGDVALPELENRAHDIAVWQATLPAGYRHHTMLAFRQVCAAGVRWKLMATNPAKDAGPNPEPRRAEVSIPTSTSEIDAVAMELGPSWGAFAVLGSETGLRPEELLALERRDIDRSSGVLLVQRAFAKGRAKEHPKTSLSRRRVPLTSRAVSALDATPARLDTPLVFASRSGRHVDLNNFRRREWAPALDGAVFRRARSTPSATPTLRGLSMPVSPYSSLRDSWAPVCE
jgi:integrase